MKIVQKFLNKIFRKKYSTIVKTVIKKINKLLKLSLSKKWLSYKKDSYTIYGNNKPINYMKTQKNKKILWSNEIKVFFIEKS